MKNYAPAQLSPSLTADFGCELIVNVSWQQNRPSKMGSRCPGMRWQESWRLHE